MVRNFILSNMVVLMNTLDSVLLNKEKKKFQILFHGIKSLIYQQQNFSIEK